MVFSKIGSFFQWILTFLGLLFTHVNNESTNPVDKVFSLEHLYDILFSTEEPYVAVHNGVLVLYEPSCIQHMFELGITEAGLPRLPYLVYLKHDYISYPGCHWYNFSAMDFMTSHYDVSSCPTVLFIKKGTQVKKPPLQWDPDSGVTFTEWVWDQLKVSVSIENNYSMHVTIRVIDPHLQLTPENYRTVMLLPGTNTLFEVPQSHTVLAYSPSSHHPHPGVFVGGWLIKEGMEISLQGDPLYQLTDEQWLSEVLQEELTHETDRHGWLWDHTARHLVNIKQPLLVPNFTTQGYKMMDIPRHLYDPLRNFYDLHKEEIRVMEPWSLKVGSINQEEVHCSMVNLPEWLMQWLHEGLWPILEHWSGKRLSQTYIYGIREYYKGNILKNHLDWLTTHVVSAILQVDKDLGDAQNDWALEVIGFDGQRRQVYLNPGQMLLYESARLIHGRPRPFKGKYFANAFVHFVPVDWTNRIEESVLYYGKDQTEDLLPVCSNLNRGVGQQAHLQQTCQDKTCT